MTARIRTLVTPQGGLEFTVVHRPRVTRRLHLELDENGGLVVVVPRDWPEFYIRRLLNQNITYVQRFLLRARQRRPPPLEYTEGEPHLVRGDPVRLRILGRNRRGTRVVLEQEALVVELHCPTRERVRNTLRGWYRDQARELFAERLRAMQARAPWARSRTLELKLRRMTRTWGTCNRDGLIRLNTHLVKAPPACLDYVISHELCHLEEMNHGPRFYALQQQLWPDWQASRRHLRDHGRRYTQE